jgi:hypothetical protein
MLLPFFGLLTFFGQSNASAFTVCRPSHLFRAMQRFCFYRLPSISPFSGNAALLVLPFFGLLNFFGQCSASAFTVCRPSHLFRAMHILHLT